MKKLLGIMVLGLLFCNSLIAKEIFYNCVDLKHGDKLYQGFDFEKMLMTQWNDQRVAVPIALIDNKYIWIEERDDNNDPKAWPHKNSRIINIFNKQSGELEKWFYSLKDNERDNLRLKLQEGKGKEWKNDGPDFAKYQAKLLNELFVPFTKFKLKCSY